MANKDEDQIKQEILAREETGKFNSLEKPSSAFSDSFTLGQNPFENIPAIIDKVIVDSKKQNSNQRQSVVVDNRKVNYYETFKIFLNERESRDLKTIKENDDVVATRCAESVEKTTKSPFYFDKNASGEEAARRAFSLHMHPKQVMPKSSEFDEIPTPGSIVDQAFKDKEKIDITINRVVKKGLNIGKDFKLDSPESPDTSKFYTNPTPYSPPAGSSTLPFIPVVSSADTPPSSNPDNESTDKTPDQKTWNPKYSPLAVGTTIYNNPKVGSKFGLRKHPITKKIRGHNGVDMWTAPLMPIVAIQDGTVSYVLTPQQEIASRYSNAYGNGRSSGGFVSVKHRTQDPSLKYYSQYMHMIKVEVKQGQKIKAGDILGFIGGGVYGYTSPNPIAKEPEKSKAYCNWPGGGNSTSAHLHFGIKKSVDGKKSYVDPLSFKYPEQVVLPDDQIRSYIKENRKIIEANREALVLLHKTKNPDKEFITKEKK